MVDVSPAPMEGPRVVLRPLLATDLEFLTRLASDPQVSFRWLFRGATPSPRTVEAAIWEQALTNFVVVERQSGLLVGFMNCYAADMRTGTAYVGAAIAPPYQGLGHLAEAGLVFLRYLFDTWNFRKLYAEMPDFNAPRFGTVLGSLMKEEGRLVAHHYLRGEFWDNVTYAIYRSDWDRLSGRWLSVLDRRTGPRRSEH